MTKLFGDTWPTFKKEARSAYPTTPWRGARWLRFSFERVRAFISKHRDDLFRSGSLSLRGLCCDAHVLARILWLRLSCGAEASASRLSFVRIAPMCCIESMALPPQYRYCHCCCIWAPGARTLRNSHGEGAAFSHRVIHIVPAPGAHGLKCCAGGPAATCRRQISEGSPGVSHALPVKVSLTISWHRQP